MFCCNVVILVVSEMLKMWDIAPKMWDIAPKTWDIAPNKWDTIQTIKVKKLGSPSKHGTVDTCGEATFQSLS